MIKDILFAGIGYIAGAFTPSVLRSVKAAFSADAKKGVSLVEGEIKAAEADVKAEAKKL
jgi:hypothetical protein